MTDRSPHVAEADRLTVDRLAARVPPGRAAVRLRREAGRAGGAGARIATQVGCDPDTASFFLGRETPVPSLRPDLPRWQERIYAFMTRNAVRAPDYFLIPPPRVVELGTKVEM